MKLVKKVKVKNSLGLHVRPAAMIVQLIQTVKASVFFTYKDVTIDAKSIMSILMLVAKRNTKITITVEGEDAKKTMDLLVDAFEGGFGEK